MGRVVAFVAAVSDPAHRRGKSGLTVVELAPGALGRWLFAPFVISAWWTRLGEAVRLSGLFAARRRALACANRELRCANDDAGGRLGCGGNCELVWGRCVSNGKCHPVAERVRGRGRSVQRRQG